jgi:hypothetical protein
MITETSFIEKLVKVNELQYTQYMIFLQDLNTTRSYEC